MTPDPRRASGCRSAVRCLVTRGDYRDVQLARFNLSAGDREVVPVLQEILRINPAVKIIASPWSAPPWMKSNGSYVVQ